MTVFWLVAACLLVAALLFIVPPLLRKEDAPAIAHTELNVTVYRDQLTELEQDLARGTITQEQFDNARHELERRLLQDATALEQEEETSGLQGSRSGAIALVMLVPLAAITLYQFIGAPYAITGSSPPAEQVARQAAEHPDSGQQIEAMVDQLAARLEDNPDDYEGWMMLARSYQFLKKPAEAARVMKEMRVRLNSHLEQNPDDLRGWLILATSHRVEKNHAAAARAYNRVVPAMRANPQMFGEGLPDLLADYADTLALANGGQLAGEPMEVINWILELDPRHVRALWLAGTFYNDKEDYTRALEYWRRIKRIVPADSQEANTMAGNIAEAEALIRASGQVVPPDDVGTQTASMASGTVAVSGRVRLSDSLVDQAAPTDTVFIFARAANGPRMPLAIVRKQVGDLPAEFTLDDSMSMMPSASLATFSEVVVGARISKSGNAMPQSGDLQGDSGVIQVGASDLDITIDSVVP
jgi:cytochrome c-type biogenesis protein CcmH